MVTIIETKVYTFSELSDKAKEKARDWYRDGALDHDWWDGVYEQFTEEMEALGFEFDTKSVPLHGGGTRQEPAIYFSGFYSQGDGACFSGRVDALKWLKAMKLGNTYRFMLNGAKVHAFGTNDDAYELTGLWVKSSGRDSHEGSMHAEIEGYNYPPADTNPRYDRIIAQENDLRDGFQTWARDQARKLWKRLRDEYEYQMSDEVVDELIEANEYTFTESGERFG